MSDRGAKLSRGTADSLPEKVLAQAAYRASSLRGPLLNANAMRLICLRLICLGLCLAIAPSVASAQSTTRSIADRSVAWPTPAQWRRVIMLEDYNTRVVLFGVAVLGTATGLVGSFTLLRKRALLGDALAHASLPGIVLAFMIASGLGLNGKSLPILLLGATLTGLMGVAVVLVVRTQTRLKEDAGLGIALSVFFGAGMTLLGVSQQMDTGHAAGLESFIYGKTASMNAYDARLIAGASLVAIICSGLLFKELKLLCFDETFAGSRGLPVVALDLALMALVVLVTIVGLQAVGLILMVALLVIPPAAARFWTERMWAVAALSGLLGCVGGLIGGAASALFPRLPSGAMIVLTSTALFVFSMFFGTARGVLIRWTRRYQVHRRIRKQHLLRGLYELLEAKHSATHHDSRSSATIERLLELRSWTPAQLKRTLAAALRERLVTRNDQGIGLTQAGYLEAARLTREHRLWELYLITHADVAPSRVDQAADAIEHVLEPDLVDELELLLEQQPLTVSIPSNPHAAQNGTPATDNEPRQGADL